MSRHSDDYLLANLQELEKSEKREDYRMVLKYAIEVVAYLPSIMSDSIINEEKLLKIISYLGDFLAVLRERDELLNLQIAFNLYSGQERLLQRVNQQLSEAASNINIMQEMIDYMEIDSEFSLEEISRLNNYEEKMIHRLITRAVQLGVIGRKKDKYFLDNKRIKLKTILRQ